MPNNPYALGRSGQYIYGVPSEAPEYAQRSVGYEEPTPENDSENGYIDNPASAGAPLSRSGSGSVYQYPVGNPSFIHRPEVPTGTAATYQPSNTDFPSAQRFKMNRYDRRPNEGAPEQFYGSSGFEGVPGIDRSIMGGEHLADDVTMKTRNTVLPGDRRFVDNPRRDPPPSTRLTSDTRPAPYMFERPYDQMNRPYGDVVVGTARRFDGKHFSMADHRRNFEILTMTPQRMARSTYRIEPEPWDTNMADLPPDNYPNSARVQDVDLPAPNRAYRLM